MDTKQTTENDFNVWDFVKRMDEKFKAGEFEDGIPYEYIDDFKKFFDSDKDEENQEKIDEIVSKWVQNTRIQKDIIAIQSTKTLNAGVKGIYSLIFGNPEERTEREIYENIRQAFRKDKEFFKMLLVFDMMSIQIQNANNKRGE